MRGTLGSPGDAIGDANEAAATAESAALLGVDTVAKGLVTGAPAAAIAPLLSVPGCPDAAADFLTCNAQIAPSGQLQRNLQRNRQEE
jgi:hypothetical protein